MLSLLRLERKQKNSLNPFRVRILLFLSYSFGIETMNTFIHSCSSLKNHTRLQTKMGNVYTRFQTKTAQIKNPTRWARTYLYSLFKGVPRGQVLHCLFKKEFRGHFLRLYHYFGLKLLLSSLIFSSEHKDIVQSGCRGYNYSVCLSATEAWLHI